MELTPPKAILYDWDNTLVDTWPVIHEGLRYCFEKMGKEPWTMEEVKANVSHSMRDYFPKLFGDRWQEAGDYYLEGYKNVHKQALEAYEGAEITLMSAQAAGLYQAVVSNKLGPTLRIEGEHIGWNKYFSALIGAGDAANDKPHPDHAYMALESYDGAKDASIWLIGDSWADIEIAERAGFTAIFYGAKDKADTIGHPIHARVSNHTEFQALLNRHI